MFPLFFTLYSLSQKNLKVQFTDEILIFLKFFRIIKLKNICSCVQPNKYIYFIEQILSNTIQPSYCYKSGFNMPNMLIVHTHLKLQKCFKHFYEKLFWQVLTYLQSRNVFCFVINYLLILTFAHLLLNYYTHLFIFQFYTWESFVQLFNETDINLPVILQDISYHQHVVINNVRTYKIILVSIEDGKDSIFIESF